MILLCVAWTRQADESLACLANCHINHKPLRSFLDCAESCDELCTESSRRQLVADPESQSAKSQCLASKIDDQDYTITELRDRIQILESLHATDVQRLNGTMNGLVDRVEEIKQDVETTNSDIDELSADMDAVENKVFRPTVDSESPDLP